jgi:hypothetical protein
MEAQHFSAEWVPKGNTGGMQTKPVGGHAA